jgi:hypothetical protein
MPSTPSVGVPLPAHLQTMLPAGPSCTRSAQPSSCCVEEVEVHDLWRPD